MLNKLQFLLTIWALYVLITAYDQACVKHGMTEQRRKAQLLYNNNLDDLRRKAAKAWRDPFKGHPFFNDGEGAQ